MFKSKVRKIIVPQYEHGRLAGTLASLWGNELFERPVIDFASFVQGVALHDWHYGIIDNLAIGEAAEVDWFEIAHKGVDIWFDDPITDIVAKLHLKRLLSGHGSPKAEEMINLIELRIAQRLPQTHYSLEHFEWADRITGCCDQLAFDFSFEAPMQGSQPVFSNTISKEETIISYEIRSGGQIVVNPWLFSVDKFHGIITGYMQAGYPETLTPEIIHYHGDRNA